MQDIQALQGIQCPPCLEHTVAVAVVDSGSPPSPSTSLNPHLANEFHRGEHVRALVLLFEHALLQSVLTARFR